MEVVHDSAIIKGDRACLFLGGHFVNPIKVPNNIFANTDGSEPIVDVANLRRFDYEFNGNV